MKLLYIVDGRSPTALNWISYFIRAGHEVHLVSTYPCAAVGGVATQYIIPIAMSNFYAHTGPRGTEKLSWLRRLMPVRVRTAIRQMAVPLSFSHAITRLEGIIERVQPELMHAMRIPYEGVLAAQTLQRMHELNPQTRLFPLLISVWGNDFTLHAQSSKTLAAQTRHVLQTCDALHTDCQRDQRLATNYGYPDKKPRIVLPGGGGVQLDVFYPLTDIEAENRLPLIINPRGFRTYVCNDTFFQAIPMVSDIHPEVRFVCPGMQGEGQAVDWVAELGIADKVELAPILTHQRLAELFRQAQITLSITTHDGTPNTLLEAMACGCFPIAGDIESIREWITPGINGMLVDPLDARQLAKAIVQVIEQPEARRQVKDKNLELIKERAEYGSCMREAEEFYRCII